MNLKSNVFLLLLLFSSLLHTMLPNNRTCQRNTPPLHRMHLGLCISRPSSEGHMLKVVLAHYGGRWNTCIPFQRRTQNQLHLLDHLLSMCEIRKKPSSVLVLLLRGHACKTLCSHNIQTDSAGPSMWTASCAFPITHTYKSREYPRCRCEKEVYETFSDASCYLQTWKGETVPQESLAIEVRLLNILYLSHLSL